jgi:hypothetical protein
MNIVIEIDWKTIVGVTVAVIICMGVYSRLFLDDDDDDDKKDGG